ncbi:MAG: restriction endonuclease subunit S [Paludibacter sp.]|nr:restriction endonuclease subunit S [Paludibacter sp.]
MREDWIEVELGEVCDIISGKNQKLVLDANGRYPIYGSGGVFGFANEYLCEPGTTVIGRKGTINSPIFVNERLWNVDTAFGISPKQINNSKYNYYFCLGFNFKKLDKSTTIPSLAKSDLLKIEFPLAPLPIQRAIVRKIENLFASLDKGIADLKTAQEQLKVYRQAVLKKAFEGEFTKEWREKQTNLQTVKELNETIDLSREKFYNQQIIEWEQAVLNWGKNGKKDKKPSKPSKLIIPEKPNAEHDNRKWDIPAHWIWTQVGTVCFVTKLAGFEYTDYVKYDDKGDLTVLKAENAGVNGFKKTEFSKIKSETVQMLKRSFLFGGELLVVFVGAGTGNVAVVPKDRKYFLGPNIGMARPYFEINSRFLEFQLQSSVGKHMMMATVKAVAQPSLSMATIRQTPIAFPSVVEQNQIVREIESRLSVCDKVEQSISEALAKAEALRQSILKKAFEGKLLSDIEIAKCKQEADYEPASKLLERIKKEKHHGK